MKIESDLRITISAASKGQKLVKEEVSWDVRNKRRREAVKALAAAKPELAKALKEAAKFQTVIDKAKAAKKASDTILLRHGLYNYTSGTSGDPIRCQDTFREKGGILKEVIRPWRPEACMARLAAAKDQKAFDAILKEYGINWK